MRLEFIGIDEAMSAGMRGPDVYYDPRYGGSAEVIDDGIWECAVTDDGSMFMPYIRRAVPGASPSDEYDIVTPYGYAGVVARGSGTDIGEFRAEFRRASLERGLIAEFLRTNPFDVATRHDAEQLRVDHIAGHRTYSVEFGDDPSSYWEQAEGRHRTAVRKAEKLEALVRECDPGDVLKPESGFRQIYDLTMDRVAAGGRLRLDDDYFHRLVSGLRESLVVLEVVLDGSVCASAIFMRWDERLHYHLSGSTPAGLAAGATNLLLDAAIRGFGRPHGMLHLGGGVQAGDGLDRFKRSISTSERTVFFCQNVINDRRYRELVDAAGVGETGYFPAYRG